MSLSVCLLIAAVFSTADITLTPDPPVAGADLIINLPPEITSGILNVGSPFGKWNRKFDLSDSGSKISVKVPDNLPVILIGIAAGNQLEFPHQMWAVTDSTGKSMPGTNFWKAYLLGSFPSPFPLDKPDLQEAIKAAEAEVKENPDFVVAKELLWRLQALDAQQTGKQDEFLKDVHSDLATSPSGRLAMAALRINLILGDRQGMSIINSGYEKIMTPIRQAEATRWQEIISTNDPRSRLVKVHDWLFDDPLSDYGSQCLQILAATYSSLGDYRSTALYGLLSLQVTPEDAMTLNGVAFAMAEGDFELERGLLLSERAVTILRNPDRLNKPPQLSERRWKRELDHALAASLDTKAWLLTKLKRWEAARRVFEEVISLEESDEYYYHYGMMLKAQGMLEEAKQKLEMGLKFSGSKRGDIQVALENLQR